jgi:MOSC domain-containing protein YiiM
MPSAEFHAGEASVAAVHASRSHGFSKAPCLSITLLAGLGVRGDAHCGEAVRHRSRVAKDPGQPNLRQVHLMHEELFAELAAQGFTVRAGELGENITSRGIALLALPRDTRLQIGESALVRLTGLRNPCVQMDRFQAGLMSAVLERDAQGRLGRKAGVMAVVEAEGVVYAGDPIRIRLPDGPQHRLEPI